MSEDTQGFTIIELLVVIVVIAILAAITLVTYVGVQERAYNAKIVTGVKNYLQAIEVYKSEEGVYPMTSPEQNDDYIAVVCLGSGYVGGGCGRISGVDVYEDSVFNDELAAILGSALIVNDQSLPSGPEAFVGAVYGIDIVTHPTWARARTIQYALHGANANCVLPGAYSYRLTETPAVTACEIILEGVD